MRSAIICAAGTPETTQVESNRSPFENGTLLHAFDHLTERVYLGLYLSYWRRRHHRTGLKIVVFDWPPSDYRGKNDDARGNPDVFALLLSRHG
jgi:hypothetical protein